MGREAKDDVLQTIPTLLDPAVVVAMRDLPDAPSTSSLSTTALIPSAVPSEEVSIDTMNGFVERGGGGSGSVTNNVESVTPFLLMQKMLRGETDLVLPNGENIPFPHSFLL